VKFTKSNNYGKQEINYKNEENINFSFALAISPINIDLDNDINKSEQNLIDNNKTGLNLFESEVKWIGAMNVN
jgi:hypothetical protein